MEQLEAVVLTKQKRIAKIVKDHKGESLKALAHYIKSGKYKAPAVKRIFIPKGNSNEKRALGLPTFDGKISIINILKKWFVAGYVMGLSPEYWGNGSKLV